MKSMVGALVIAAIIGATFYLVESNVVDKHPEAPNIAIVTPQKNWEDDIYLGVDNWYVDDFGTATWVMTIENMSDTNWYKDPNIKVFYKGKSGTVIYTSILGHTEYVNLPPGSKTKITFTDMMAPKQAVRAGAFVDKVTPR